MVPLFLAWSQVYTLTHQRNHSVSSLSYVIISHFHIFVIIIIIILLFGRTAQHVGS